MSRALITGATWARGSPRPTSDVHGLVNNAGIPFRARLQELELADWDRVIGINLTGTLLGIQAVAPLMPAGGSIVNVGSIAGLSGHYTAAYTVSKWGCPRAVPRCEPRARRQGHPGQHGAARGTSRRR